MNGHRVTLDSDTSLQEEKKALRNVLRARRAKVAARAGRAGTALRDVLAAALSLPANGVVAGYLPMGDEIDVLPTVLALRASGHEIGMPVVIGRGKPLQFRRWRPEDPLEDGPLGTKQPCGSAPVVRPDVLIVPLLGYDRRGYRLGYGGGFYDRTVAALRAAGEILAIGVGFPDQEVAHVPRGPQDEAMDWIVTPQEAFRVEGEA